MTRSIAFSRIDHLICEVPDLEAALALFAGRFQLPIAWPAGRFWPGASTCGVAIGGLNLEFIELDENAPTVARISTLAFEPTSLDQALQAFEASGLSYEEYEKVEADPGLLRLRGFSDADAATPQQICVNLAPTGRDLPFDFFACQYSPFLRDWLSPGNHRLLPAGREVRKIVYGTPQPEEAEKLLESLLFTDTVELTFVQAETKGVLEIHITGEPLDMEGWNAAFTIVPA